MKSTSLLFFSFFLYSFCLAQSDRLPLKTQLLTLENQYNVKFSYSDDLINRLVVDDISIDKDRELNYILQDISLQTGLVFEQIDANVVLINTADRNYCIQLVDDESLKVLKSGQALINNKTTNIISDDNGYMRFSGRFTFQDTIMLKFFGYKNKKVAFKTLTETCQKVPMSFTSFTLEEVIFTHYITKGIDVLESDHSLVIDTKNLSLLPGDTDSDILLAIKTLPGISSPDGKAGNLHVRGSTADQTLVLVDDIPIYHKGHYYGAISAFNQLFIDKVSVYRSGFDPSTSGRVGGAISLESSTQIPDSSLYNIGVNSLYASALASIPVNDNWSVRGSVRSSLPGDWQSPKLKELDKLVFANTTSNPNSVELEDTFTYNDANFSSTYKNENTTIQLSILTINNLQKQKRNNIQRNTLFSTETDLSNDGINLTWNQKWSEKFNTEAFTSYSHYDYNSRIQEYFFDTQQLIKPDQFKENLKDYSFGLRNYLLLGKSRLNFGYASNKYVLNKSSFSERPNRSVMSFSDENIAYLHNLYINQQTDIGDKFSISAGLSGLLYTVTDVTRLEPRVFLNYKLTDQWSLKSSAGLYSQYVTQNVFFDFEDVQAENQSWELAKYNRPVVKSSLYMFGSSWSPSTFIIDVEGYYKEITDLSTINPNVSLNSPFPFTSGDLNIYGLDLLISNNWGKVDTWASYSYTVTEMDFPELNQRSFETYYDQPHTLNIGATADLNRWKLSLGWQYLTGIPIYTNNSFFPVPGDGNDPNAEVPSEENEGRFDSQHQLDVAAVYQFPAKSKGWVGTIGLSLLNVYDQKNLVSSNYVTRGPITSLENRYAIGFAPNLMLSIKW